MGNIIVWLGLSVDGFFEGPDADISWHQVDDELHTYMNDHLSQMSGFLMGRVTYQLLEDFWPTADQDPELAQSMAEFSPIWRDIPKIVYSRTLEAVGPNATLVRDVTPAQVQALKEQASGDFTVGGPDLIASFLAQDLIDEYVLFIHPVAIGTGQRLFGPEARVSLQLRETRAFSNGVVMLRYLPGADYPTSGVRMS